MIFHYLNNRILSIIYTQTYEFHKKKCDNMYKLNIIIKIIGMKLSNNKKNVKTHSKTKMIGVHKRIRLILIYGLLNN